MSSNSFSPGSDCVQMHIFTMQNFYLRTQDVFKMSSIQRNTGIASFAHFSLRLWTVLLKSQDQE